MTPPKAGGLWKPLNGVQGPWPLAGSRGAEPLPSSAAPWPTMMASSAQLSRRMWATFSSALPAPAAAAREQLEPDIVLETGNQGADGRLGPVEIARRLRNRAGQHDFPESTQLFEIQLDLQIFQAAGKL